MCSACRWTAASLSGCSFGVKDNVVSGAQAPAAAALSVNGFRALSPDGKSIAIWANDPETPADKARKDRKDDSYIHRDDDDHDRTHLYVIDAATGRPQDRPQWPLSNAKWSFDGADMIAVTDPQSDVTGPDATVWQVRPLMASATKLDLPKSVGTVAMLPGRARPPYMDQCADDAPPRCNDLLRQGHTKTGAAPQLHPRGLRHAARRTSSSTATAT